MTTALRPVTSLSDNELLTETAELDRLSDISALANPAKLLRHVTPDTYRVRPHIRVIAMAVARIRHPDPAQRVDRVLIRVPPQTGKTVTAVVGTGFWWLANRPQDRVIIGSYNDALAKDRGRDVRKLVRQHGYRWGLELERGSADVSDWRITKGGGVKSVGVGSGVVGSPGDIGIIDDPHKSREEADNLRMRDRAYNWLSGDIISRLSPRSPLLLVMTPWHPDDMSSRVLADQGRLEDGGRWLVIDMPALCTDPKRDPLRRAYGAPLPHPKIATRDAASALRHWEDKRSSSTVQDWSSQYQLDPKPPEGALLSRELLRERRCYLTAGLCDTSPLRSAVAVDPSGGGRDVAGIIGGYLGSDKRCYISHDRSGVMTSAEWAARACELAVEIDADRIIVETNYGGDMATLTIKNAWSKLRAEELTQYGGDQTSAEYIASAKYRRLCPRVVSVRARKNKRLRADPVAGAFIADRIRFAAYLPETEDEWATWQSDHTDSPGRIDASVYLAMDLLPPVPSSSAGTSGAVPTGHMPTTSATPLGGYTSGGFGTSSFGPLATT